MTIFDISLSLRSDLAIWPGDTPFGFDLKWKKMEGATSNVGAITMGVHDGTHVDAPLHFQLAGDAVDQCSLAKFFGPALVVDLCERDAREAVITRSDLECFSAELRHAPRLLLKTNAWRDHTIFPTTIPVLEPLAVDLLRSLGVILLGLDLPSVDRIDSEDLPNHHALADAGIAILESLDLSAVSGGRYNLAALPLKIVGGDAAPVRAILWQAD